MVTVEQAVLAVQMVGGSGKLAIAVGVSKETLARFLRSEKLSPSSLSLLETGIARVLAGDTTPPKTTRAWGKHRKSPQAPVSTGLKPADLPSAKVESPREVLDLIHREANTIREEQSLSEQLLRLSLRVIELEKDNQAYQAEARAVHTLARMG